jgi:5-methyltetrahydrofolate--homocysteine methyltransferase
MANAPAIVNDYRSASDLPIIAQPNAGKPELQDGKTVYRETPEEMAAGVRPLLEAGARIVGSCCGSSPDHIRAIRKVMDEYIGEEA